MDSYPAVQYQYVTSINEEDKNVDALVCQTDDFTFGLFILTPSSDYDKAVKKAAADLIKSAELFTRSVLIWL